MEPRAPKKEVYISQQLSNHKSIFWMLIQRHLDLRGWKTEALSVQSTLGGSIREPSIQSRKSLHAVPPLPTQHAGGLSSTLSLAVEPSRAYSSPRRMIVLHLCSISLTASPTADSAVRGRPCPQSGSHPPVLLTAAPLGFSKPPANLLGRSRTKLPLQK